MLSYQKKVEACEMGFRVRGCITVNKVSLIAQIAYPEWNYNLRLHIIRFVVSLASTSSFNF